MRLGIWGTLIVLLITPTLVFADGDWLPKSPDQIEKVKKVVTGNVRDLAEKAHYFPLSLVSTYVDGLMNSMNQHKGQGIYISQDGQAAAKFMYTMDENGNIRTVKIVKYKKDFSELFSKYNINQNEWGTLIHQFNSLGYAAASIPSGSFKLRYDFEKGNFVSQRKTNTVSITKETLGSKVITSAANGAAGTDYLTLIGNKIHQQWVPPENVDKSLIAMINCRITENGNVTILGFEKKSGNGLFDRAALKAINNAAQLPPPSTEMEIGVTFYP